MTSTTTRTTAEPKKRAGSTGRRAGGVVLLLLGPLVAAAVGLLAVLAVAPVVTVAPLLLAAGLIGVAATALVAGRWGFRPVGAGRVAPYAYTAVVTVVIAATAALTVLAPGPTAVSGPAPVGLRFWELPTGSRIAYTAQPAVGPSRPTPVIFLHGGPGTPGNGLPAAAPALARDGFDVYAYDQVGGGRSSRLTDVTDYTVARHVADLEAIRVAVGADQVVLVGQSWGATLAGAYLAAHPTRVAKAVFTSPGALWDPAFPGGVGDLWQLVPPANLPRQEALLSTPRVQAMALLLEISPQAVHTLVPDAEADAFLHELAVLAKDASACPGSPGGEVHDNIQGFYVNQLTDADAAEVPDPRPALRASTVPALIMRGECDYVRPEVAEDYRQTLSRSTLVAVPGAGHSISGSQPAAYLAALRAFLLDRPAPTR